VTPASEPTTVVEALQAVGHPVAEPPRRPVLRHRGAVLVTLATLDPGGRAVWHGLWVEAGHPVVLGPTAPPSSGAARAAASELARPVIDLAAASSLSLLERLEELGVEVDRLETRAEPAPLAVLGELQRGLAQVRTHLFRLELLMAELGGPLGETFPGIAPAVAELSPSVARSAELASGLQQACRDLIGLRTAVEANRLAEAANELGRTSNGIAALANNSNVRMLGVAYVALALALVSAVVLIPNTAATILGMPSAAWVPGIWVDALLVLLAVVPVVVVFSRPWVRRMLRGWREYGRRSGEGLAALPELPPATAERPSEAERLIRGSP